MAWNRITIERERNQYKVCATDPKIEEANRANDKSDSPSSWKDPQVEYLFETQDQALKFVTLAMDIALPADEYSTAFDKFAKQAKDG